MNGMDGKWPIYEQFFELRKGDFPQQLEDVRIRGDIMGI